MLTSREEPKNWVKLRTECNLDLTFESLAQVVERDVAEINKLPTKHRRGYEFKFEQNCEGTRPLISVVRHDPGNPDEEQKKAVTFEKSIHSIRVHLAIPGAGRSFLVTPEWNADSASCLLKVNDEYMKVWQICQKALSPLFFEH